MEYLLYEIFGTRSVSDFLCFGFSDFWKDTKWFSMPKLKIQNPKCSNGHSPFESCWCAKISDFRAFQVFTLGTVGRCTVPPGGMIGLLT